MLRKLSFGVAAFAIAFATPPQLRAGDSPEAVASKLLTGGATRDWLAGSVKTWMGSSTSCSPVEVYHFSMDMTVRIEECLNGKRLETKTTWTLMSKDSLDMLINVGEKTYYLIFAKQNGRQHMILRERGDSKVEPITDHDFSLSED
jgi:hypothetical protein